MISLQGLNTILTESDAEYNGIDYVSEAAFIDETVSCFLTEAAKDDAKAILKGEDMKKAKQIIKEAKKLAKTDPEAGKKKAKEATAIVRKLIKEAEKIEDDNSAAVTIKIFLPVIWNLTSAMVMVYGGPTLMIPAMISVYVSFIPEFKVLADMTYARISQTQRDPASITKMLDTKHYTKNKVIGILNEMLGVIDQIGKKNKITAAFFGYRRNDSKKAKA